jgi:hypothetical protein
MTVRTRRDIPALAYMPAGQPAVDNILHDFCLKVYDVEIVICGMLLDVNKYKCVRSWSYS